MVFVYTGGLFLNFPHLYAIVERSSQNDGADKADGFLINQGASEHVNMDHVAISNLFRTPYNPTCDISTLNIEKYMQNCFLSL